MDWTKEKSKAAKTRLNFDNLKLVIFDKDGLIMDTEAPVYAVWKEVFSELKLPPLTREMYTGFIGYDRRENIRRINEFYPGIDGEAIFSSCAVRVREYLENNPIRTMPGLFELLDVLDEKGLKKAVATSSRSQNAHMTLKKCGVFSRVDTVISGDMIERSKPAPDIFLKAAEAVGVRPSECLVLEDSNAGVMGAFAAGIPVIVIPDMIDTPPEIVELCECRCDSLFDVMELFLSC